MSDVVITWSWKPQPRRFLPISTLNVSNTSTWYRAEGPFPELEPMTSKPKN
jgi:hypothetical protein